MQLSKYSKLVAKRQDITHTTLNFIGPNKTVTSKKYEGYYSITNLGICNPTKNRKEKIIPGYKRILLQMEVKIYFPLRTQK